MTSAILMSVISFPASSPAQTAGVTSEQIVCPDLNAAENGSFLDRYYLARAYEKGYCGVAANHENALVWYRSAAEGGHMLAQYELGEMYFTGEGVPIDYPQAKRWFLAAATQGHGLSQLRLAFLYAEAHFKGLTVDYEEAEKWFLKAAEQNAGDARFRLGNFYHNYKRPPDDAKAIYWLTKAAEGGHRVAMFDLSRMLKDPQQSLMWLTKAAEHGLLSAQMTLSEMYAEGKTVPKDMKKSMIWTMKVAMTPGAPAFWINQAADTFFNGSEGIPQDYRQALKLYERNLMREDPHALAQAGLIYLKGLGVKADPAKGREYLRKAAAKGNAEAQSLLLDQK